LAILAAEVEQFLDHPKGEGSSRATAAAAAASAAGAGGET